LEAIFFSLLPFNFVKAFKAEQIGGVVQLFLHSQSSTILAANLDEWIESDECVRSCGLERLSFGLSTDLLLDSRSTAMLCSPECLNNCPNIIDLYINLAAGEGMHALTMTEYPAANHIRRKLQQQT
jgi:hypothetical protein